VGAQLETAAKDQALGLVENLLGAFHRLFVWGAFLPRPVPTPLGKLSCSQSTNRKPLRRHSSPAVQQSIMSHLRRRRAAEASMALGVARNDTEEATSVHRHAVSKGEGQPKVKLPKCVAGANNTLFLWKIRKRIGRDSNKPRNPRKNARFRPKRCRIRCSI